MMNKAKKALIATSLAGALVVSAGYGTYSWFTAEKSATGTITNGTLTLGDASGHLFDHAKFAPSQLLMANWTSFENTGNLAEIFKVTYTESLNMAQGSLGNYSFQGYALTVPTSYNLTNADKAFYENAIRSYLGGGNPTTAAAAELPKLPDGSSVQKIDSAQDAKAATAKAATANDSRTTSPGWEQTLPVGYKIVIIAGVKLSSDAGNEYQGAVYNGTLKVNGKQTDKGAQF
jgi:spore coat-associated protein N